MRRFVFLFSLFICSLFLFPQDRPLPSSRVHIEVPVRVFEGDAFVSNLTLADFELREDGETQSLDAIYLVSGNLISRRDERRKFAPETKRNFYLIFEISEYATPIDSAVAGFIRNVLSPQDTLTIITPLKTYRMKSSAFDILPREEFLRQLSELIKRDALQANPEYRNILAELNQAAEFLSRKVMPRESMEWFSPMAGLRYTSPDELITRYSSLLQMLADMRMVSEERILNLASNIKQLGGRKHIVLFYQREPIRTVRPNVLVRFEQMHNDNPSVLYPLSYLESSLFRDLSFNSERITRTLSDSNISIHFKFFAAQSELSGGIDFVRRGEDVFQDYRRIAEKTGGTIAWIYGTRDTSLEISGDTYLLYYTPRSAKPAEEFREIEVTVKRRGLKAYHRAGYIGKRSE
jgi:hypothetical protein